MKHNFDLRKDENLNEINQVYQMRLKDRVKSFLSLEEFARLGSRVSILYISDMFLQGVDLDDLTIRAKRWNECAKNLHVTAASYRFGKGFYKIKDFAAAYEALSWGAEQGYAPSMYILARMYFGGVYVDKNLNKCRELLESAAKQGRAWAKKDLVYVLLMHKFGFAAKMRAIMIYFTLFYYQIDYIIKLLKKTPLEEKYYR